MFVFWRANKHSHNNTADFWLDFRVQGGFLSVFPLKDFFFKFAGRAIDAVLISLRAPWCCTFALVTQIKIQIKQGGYEMQWQSHGAPWCCKLARVINK